MYIVLWDFGDRSEQVCKKEKVENFRDEVLDNWGFEG